jgi:enterochelin esterase-like enzyme
MKIRLLLALVGVAIGFAVASFAQQKEPTPSESIPVVTPTPTLGDHFTQILPDRRVTFRLLAPNAKAVEVVIGLKDDVHAPGTTGTGMSRDADGLWTVTIGPLEPNLYQYQFSVDGLKIADPGNEMLKPQRQVDTSLLLIPGTPPDFLDVQTGAHGTIRDETYYSTVLAKNRRVLVYTPPSYGHSNAAFPVLYLYHGFFDTRYSWVTEGRLAQILDNLLTEGKAVPMVVVVPEAHALPYEATPITNPNNYWANLSAYWARNQAAVDEELFHDVIPFIEAHYSISSVSHDRAIAGLSMGGLQAMGTGLTHPGYFSWIGAFGPTPPSALGDEITNALKDPDKINKHLSLFELIIGDSDGLVGPTTQQFDGQLSALNIRHAYTVLPGGHCFFVWRPALSSFLQEIFKH